MTSQKLLASTMVLAVTASCAEGPTGPGDALTRGEALAIAGQVADVGRTAPTSVGVSRPGDGVSADPFVIRTEHRSRHPCPVSGRVTLDFVATATVDEPRAVDLEVDGTLTHAACAFKHDDITLTVTGDPDLAFDASLALRNGRPTEPYTASVEGAVLWEASDGRSGRCVIDLVTITDFDARRSITEGRVCDHEVRRVTTWS